MQEPLGMIRFRTTAWRTMNALRSLVGKPTNPPSPTNEDPDSLVPARIGPRDPRPSLAVAEKPPEELDS